MIVLGLMSGTSADGIDTAITKIQGTGHKLQVSLIGFHSVAYSENIRDRILIIAEKGTVSDICHMNVLLGEHFARAALACMRRFGLSLEKVQLIGSHGQTIYHRPIPVREPTVGAIRSTLQIGDAAVIAERTGITTVSDFRARDLAAGGEGAPLAPYAHHLLFGHQSLTRLVVNLGGIANVTLLPAGGIIRDVRAFDTGPCNMLLDGLVSVLSDGKQIMDRGGKVAKRGQVDSRLLERLLRHPFISKPPPKSTGREEFGHSFITQILNSTRRRKLSPEDILSTCCRFIAASISMTQQWFNHSIDEVVLGGGGVFNQRLMNEITQVFHPISVNRMEAHGSHSKAFEAEAFAVLAYQTFQGICANVPTVTGARHPVILGSIVPGRNSGSP